MESIRNKAKRTRATAAAIAFGMASFVMAERPARAEGPVSASGKGIAGLAIVGGSVTAMTMGIVGVEQRWAYLVFPPLVAVGAGIGGYYMEDAAPVEASTYILGAGMALVIPTVIVSLNATVFRVPDEYTTDPSKKTPAREPPRPGARLVNSFRAGHVPRSLVDIHQGTLAMGLPPVQIKSTFTTEELAKFGVAQAREVHVPLFHASF